MHLLILHERRVEVVNIYTILLQTKLYVWLKHFNYMYALLNLHFLKQIFFADPTTRTYGYYGRVTSGIYLDNLGCLGSESRLIDCYHSPIGVHNCYHGEDVRMRCRRKTMHVPL